MARSTRPLWLRLHTRQNSDPKRAKRGANGRHSRESPPYLWTICMARHCWWPYMNRELIVKSTECKPSTAIGKNPKSVISAKQFKPDMPRDEPNQEKQIDFGGPILMKKGIKYNLYLQKTNFQSSQMHVSTKKLMVLMY